MGTQPLERVTANLVPRAVAALDEAVGLTGDSKTDTINRSLQLYGFVAQVIANGGFLYVRESEDADMERLRIL